MIKWWSNGSVGANSFGTLVNLQNNIKKTKSFNKLSTEFDEIKKKLGTKESVEIDGIIYTQDDVAKFEEFKTIEDFGDVTEYVTEKDTAKTETQIKAIESGVKAGTITKEELTSIKNMSKKFNMKIDYFYDASNVKGTYDPLTSTIGINTANTENITTPAVHEFMHSVETSNPKAYAQFYNETMKLIKNNQKFTDMAETTRKTI